MSLRARIFIIVSVIVLLVLSVSIFLYVRGKNKNNNPIPVETTPTSTGTGEVVLPSGQGATEIPAGIPVKTITPLEAQKNGVEQLAKTFVERYGTYSTDNESQNIKESQELVTPALWAKIGASLGASSSGQPFYGITTKIISTNITSWSETKATVSLKAMRTEDKNGTISSRNQNVTVEMVKEGEKWLASSIAWN